jgi:hypothetical protein
VKVRIFPADKKKTIALRNPSHIRVRNNFRAVLIEALYRKLDEYHEKDAKKKRSMKYGRLKQELRDLERKSICRCPRCSATDRDMTFNPIDDTWYCTECYQEMHHWTANKKTGESVRFP